jgi:hypothetical protein
MSREPPCSPPPGRLQPGRENIPAPALIARPTHITDVVEAYRLALENQNVNDLTA